MRERQKRHACSEGRRSGVLMKKVGEEERYFYGRVVFRTAACFCQHTAFAPPSPGRLVGAVLQVWCCRRQAALAARAQLAGKCRR